MTGPVFVDANVLVYLYDAAYPAKQAAALEWIERLWQEGIGRTSAQALSEFYVNVTRKLPHPISAARAAAEVNAYAAWSPQPVDMALLELGQTVEARYRLNWWDCLIVAAAQRQNCELLLTEDLQDGASYGGVRVRNPFVDRIQDGPAELRAPRPRYSRRPSAMR